MDLRETAGVLSAEAIAAALAAAAKDNADNADALEIAAQASALVFAGAADLRRHWN